MTLCRKCNVEYKPTAHEVKKSDLMCKPCRKEYNRAYRQKRKEGGNPVVGGKMDKEYHKKYAEKYYKNADNRKARAEYMRKRRKDPEQQHKLLARDITNKAIKSGRLKRGPCVVCGEKKVDAHHEDYFKPLEVVWLCRKHHVEHHKKAKGE